MASWLLAEDAAKVVLKVFVTDFDCRPGENLRSTSFYKSFTGRKEDSDFASGMDYAIAQGWVELASENVYRLTEAGYLEMQAPEPEPVPDLPAAPTAVQVIEKAYVAPPGTITLSRDEAEFVLRFVSGQKVAKKQELQDGIKVKILAEAQRIAKLGRQKAAK